ncbi:Kinetochore-associated protein 1 [Nowakowskiella sp. JEL0078]|nr:Kinetochore-associated protein 1 [Nowakowskiella sp. JEL0078]
MPEEIKPNQFVPWLQFEVLPILKNFEDRSSVGKWIENRARIVENIEEAPHGALSVVSLLDFFDSSSDTSNFVYGAATPSRYVEFTVLSAQTSGFGSQKKKGTSSSILKSQLEDIVYLWDIHDFRVSLSDYAQSSASEIALEILDRVAAPELLGDAIEEHFKPYVERNSLSFEDLLVEYSLEQMDGAVSQPHSLIEASWEARVLVVVGCVTDKESKLDVILEIMRRTTVPWSEEVGELFLNALRWPALKKTDELREQYRLLRLKRMLIKYGIKGFNISDLSLSKSLLKFVLAKTDFTDSIDDAMQIVTAYHTLHKFEAYVIRLQNLCKEGQIQRAINLLRYGSELGLNQTYKIEFDPKSDKDLGLDIKVDLEPLEMLSVGQEVISWLVEIIEEIAEKHGPFGENGNMRNPDEKNSKKYKWAINSAVILSFELADILNNLSENSSTFKSKQDDVSAVSQKLDQTKFMNSKPQKTTITSSLLIAAYETTTYAAEKIYANFRNLQALCLEFNIALDLQSYESESIRRNVLGLGSRQVFAYSGRDKKQEIDKNVTVSFFIYR